MDTDQNRFPELSEVLSKIADESELAGSSVERMEIHLHASGEASARIWAPYADEPEILYWPPATP